MVPTREGYLGEDAYDGGASSDRCRWQREGAKKLGSHLRLGEQGEDQMLSGNPVKD